MAIAHNDGFSVGMAETAKSSVRKLGDVRVFKSYESADEAARFIAEGKCDTYKSGCYVSNR